MKRLFAVLAALFWCAAGGSAHAAESACARVSIEIIQELTLERVAFDARLVIHNKLPDQDIRNVRVDVTILDAAGNIRNELFFMRVSSLDKIEGVDGTGTVYRNTSAEAHWLIIPSPGAGGESATGIPYFVGATLTYTINGNQEILPINPDKITVRPTAQLYLDYFMPFAVLGDNPFTAQTEAPIPFPLAVRVLNDGFGPANKLKIDSAQPKIVDNQQGLLVDFKLLGAAVNDSAVSPSLTVDMGDVGSKRAATGYWEMISTLSGRFVEFKATFTHASELGGELTSLIKETNAHYLVHRIKANLPGRDGLLDFLADTDRDEAHLPDAVFESEIPSGGTDRNAARSPVIVVQPSSPPPRPTTQQPEVAVTLSLTGNPLGWIYTKMADPSQGLLKLLKVVRADGVTLDPHNSWVEEGLDKDYKPIHTLQFVDYRADGAAPGSYALVFTQPDEDVAPPTTTLVFDGPVVAGETTYLTPATRIVLTARDNEGGSGVDAMFKRTDASATFSAAVPLTLPTGTFDLEFYSVDRAGNVEPSKTQRLLVDDAAPEITAALQASPATFSPQAPRGVTATRNVTFTFTATDAVPNLPVSLQIADGSGKVVRTLEGIATAGNAYSLTWDGVDADGRAVPAGSYTATLTVADGLGHTATGAAAITAAEWFAGTPVDPVPGAIQLYPAVAGTRAVWQDDRNGHFDLYLKDLADLAAASTRITTDPGSQERPAVEGDRIVWQDDRNGTWDIYGYDLATSQEFTIDSGPGDQTHPIVAADWVVWQDNRAGNWDIRAKNLATGQERQITSHERDQIRPAISGTLLAWEDYRHGLGEIYQIDLAGGAEARLTFDIDNQILPAVSGSLVVWTDQREGRLEIYRLAGGGAERLTYGSGDRSQGSLAGSLLVYTDFAQDANLAFLDLTAGRGGMLTTHPARQEEPAAGEGVVAWQDDRDGTFQIYLAELSLADLPVEVELAPGFNLIAAGQLLVDTYGSAAALIGDNPGDLGFNRLLTYSAPHGQFFEADLAGGDFALAKGAGLIVYAQQAGTLAVAAAGEEGSYTLLPGANHIGLLSVPAGYRAYDLLRSVGMSNAVSVRRFDNRTGLWQSAAVREGADGPEIVGANFEIKPGDGLVVTMKTRVDGWKP